jgi:hypothetical protein
VIGVILGTLAVVGAAIAVGTWVTRKRGLVPRPDELAAPPKQRPAYAAGEAPATAIRAGAAQLDRLRTTQRCASCRAKMTVTGEEHVRYNDRDMLVIDLRCDSCGARRPLYVVPSAATPTTA